MIYDTKTFYNKFSALYPLIDLLLRSQKKTLFEEVNKLPQGKLLEIGVGNGAHFSKYKKHQVTGIDNSRAMLNIARSRQHPGIKLIQMDAEALLFSDEQFDYVLLSHVIAVVNNHSNLLNEALRVLKPNGYIIILNHFTPSNWLKYIDHAFQMVSKMFRFKSVFYTTDIKALGGLNLVKEIDLGFGSYFKLLIYQKN